jgi:hypothetical protein
MTGSKGQTGRNTHVPCPPRLVEQPPAADAFQRPLRSRFQARRSALRPMSTLHLSVGSLTHGQEEILYV